MTPYTYSGPVTGIEIDGAEKMVRPGDEIALPPDHPITVGWLAHGYLTPLAGHAPSAPEIPAASAPAKRAVKEA